MRREGQNLFDYGIAGVVVEFANFLKVNGFRIFQSSIQDSLKALQHINLFNKQEVFYTLRANLVKTDMEWIHFPHLFDQFWNIYIKKLKQANSGKKRETAFIEDISEEETGLKEERKSKGSSKVPFEEEKKYLEGIGYSPISKVEKKDLNLLDESDIHIAKLALKQMAEPFKIQRTRRTKKGLRFGEKMDFSRIMRRSLKFEGYPIELFFKERKKRLKKLIIIADVSGSMERYASFVVPFILSIRGIGSKAEVFVFSTSLTRVTHIVRHMDFEKALKKIGEEVPNWAGGTRIGFSLKQFNSWGREFLNRRSVVMILSDGWDLGSQELLRREMEKLRKKAYSIIWLNPILDDPNMKRMCKGMLIALPYLDYVLPVNSLESLKRIGKIISRLMLH